MDQPVKTDTAATVTFTTKELIQQVNDTLQTGLAGVSSRLTEIASELHKKADEIEVQRIEGRLSRIEDTGVARDHVGAMDRIAHLEAWKNSREAERTYSEALLAEFRKLQEDVKKLREGDIKVSSQWALGGKLWTGALAALIVVVDLVSRFWH